MNINIKISGRYKKQIKELSPLFNKYKQRIQKIMHVLSQKYKLKLPKEIVLRPLYIKKGNSDFYAKIIHDINGYQVAINLNMCLKLRDKGLEVIDHECAHFVVDIIHNGNFRHGSDFKKMYSYCRKI